MYPYFKNLKTINMGLLSKKDAKLITDPISG